MTDVIATRTLPEAWLGRAGPFCWPRDGKAAA